MICWWGHSPSPPRALHAPVLRLRARRSGSMSWDRSNEFRPYCRWLAELNPSPRGYGLRLYHALTEVSGYNRHSGPHYMISLPGRDEDQAGIRKLLMIGNSQLCQRFRITDPPHVLQAAENICCRPGAARSSSARLHGRAVVTLVLGVDTSEPQSLPALF